MTMFYRCTMCTQIVSPWDIKGSECPNCGGHKIRPTNLSFFEKAIQICKNWKRLRKVPGKIELEFSHE